VHNQARFILVILDNSITAMTGMQPTADSGLLADGRMGNRVAIKDLVQACGVKFIEEIDPYRVKDFQDLVKRARDYIRQEDGGIAVIISKRPCPLYDPTPLRENPVRVTVTEECDNCKYCLTAFECPALVLDEDLGRVVIDRRICTDCGVCIDVCHKGFIVEAPLQ
jgi:indolepyruvate ferredoxin oxidoreductase alpha subunit